MPPILIVFIALAAFLLLLPFFLLAPRAAGKRKRAPFVGRNFAHRWLYEREGSVPENSLTAFARAADAGYGMELDVQLSRDGEVVVFHDDTLDRVCGVHARVDELDLEELRRLRLCGTDEQIPLFSEVLRLVNGRAPIIVELKNGKRNKELCRKTLNALRSYRGETCIESFNPFIVAWFRFHAPSVFRGQLAQPPQFYLQEGFSKTTGFLLGHLLMNAIARPHFIAYRIGKKPLSVRFAEALGAVRVAWTSHDPSSENRFDAVIFEHYRPKPRFRVSSGRSGVSAHNGKPEPPRQNDSRSE